jgi:hypothetical protein
VDLPHKLVISVPTIPHEMQKTTAFVMMAGRVSAVRFIQASVIQFAQLA